MAKASIFLRDVKTEKMEKEKRFILDLSLEEAATLKFILGKCSGANSITEHAYKIFSAIPLLSIPAKPHFSHYEIRFNPTLQEFNEQVRKINGLL